MAHHWQVACALFLLFSPAYGYDNDQIPITLVEDAVKKAAVCIDGSPAGYYYASGFEEGANDWIVYLMGGGWCGTKWACQQRRGIFLGSTLIASPFVNFTGILSSNPDINPDFYNWNRVYVHYCDGSSFLGDSEILDLGPSLQLRGSRIFSAVMDELLAKGMKNANNALLAGGSAGGLATILNCDRFRLLLNNTCRVKCLSDGGFFIHAKDLPRADFREGFFGATIEFHNLTSFLPTSCTSKMNSSLCLFPEYLIEDIQTPLFLLNSAFDVYQIQVNLNMTSVDPHWEICSHDITKCTPNERQLITDFGAAFRQTLEATDYKPSMGMFISACFSHVYSVSNTAWNSCQSPRLEDMTTSQAVGDWYFDRSCIQLVDRETDYPVICAA